MPYDPRLQRPLPRPRSPGRRHMSSPTAYRTRSPNTEGRPLWRPPNGRVLRKRSVSQLERGAAGRPGLRERKWGCRRLWGWRGGELRQGHGYGPDLPLEEVSLAARPTVRRARSGGGSQVAELSRVRNGTAERRAWGPR